MNSSLSPAERLWAELVREQKYPPVVIEIAGAMGTVSHQPSGQWTLEEVLARHPMPANWDPESGLPQVF
ncbi:hypothetical protein EJO66_32165 [Variovorax beijingensis]|uniref:Uncharacterized protein n=1 Tax=Variovorax beijingensis TaxID=2496117 RepID=A0ABX9ZWY6_9BURK|nr:hypothetical protein [Variovorax beijingensis]RSZ24085.1 hypothetical protein EJO66_32165 [Variovorax beijingensis]